MSGGGAAAGSANATAEAPTADRSMATDMIAPYQITNFVAGDVVAGTADQRHRLGVPGGRGGRPPTRSPSWRLRSASQVIRNATTTAATCIGRSARTTAPPRRDGQRGRPAVLVATAALGPNQTVVGVGRAAPSPNRRSPWRRTHRPAADLDVPQSTPPRPSRSRPSPLHGRDHAASGRRADG